MNNLYILSKFLTSKLHELTNLQVYSHTAPLDEKNNHICFFIQNGEPIVYTNQIQAFEEFSIIIHNWQKGDTYDYDTAENIQKLKNIQGMAIDDGVILSCLYKGQNLITSDIQEKWFGIATNFVIRVSK